MDNLAQRAISVKEEKFQHIVHQEPIMMSLEDQVVETASQQMSITSVKHQVLKYRLEMVFVLTVSIVSKDRATERLKTRKKATAVHALQDFTVIVESERSVLLVHTRTPQEQFSNQIAIRVTLDISVKMVLSLPVMTVKNVSLE